jgi:hypothetical protein
MNMKVFIAINYWFGGFTAGHRMAMIARTEKRTRTYNDQPLWRRPVIASQRLSHTNHLCVPNTPEQHSRTTETIQQGKALFAANFVKVCSILQ